VQDLLENLGIRDQAFARTDKIFKQSLRIRLMRMSRSDEVHGDFEINQNEAWLPALYPLSISESMLSMSPVG